MHGQAARIARLAWLFTFVVPLLLATLLFGVRSSPAAPGLAGIAPTAFEEEEGFGEEAEAEFAEQECEIAEEEFEEGLLGEAEVEALCEEAESEGGLTAAAPGANAGAPSKCPLRSARARAVLRRKRLKLTVGYTAASSTPATIEVRAGNRRIATVHRRLGRSGVIRIVKKLGRKRVKRVLVRFKTPTCKFQIRSQIR